MEDIGSEISDYLLNLTGDINIENDFINDPEFMNDYVNNLTIIITLLSIGISLIFIGLIIMALVLCYLLTSFSLKSKSHKRLDIFQENKKYIFREFCFQKPLICLKYLKSLFKFMLSILTTIKFLIINLLFKRFFYQLNYFLN
jgi:hypothetical protein